MVDDVPATHDMQWQLTTDAPTYLVPYHAGDSAILSVSPLVVSSGPATPHRLPTPQLQRCWSVPQRYHPIRCPATPPGHPVPQPHCPVPPPHHPVWAARGVTNSFRTSVMSSLPLTSPMPFRKSRFRFVSNLAAHLEHTPVDIPGPRPFLRSRQGQRDMVITSMSESSQSMRLVATMEVTRKPAMEEGPPPKVLGAALRVQFLEWPRTRFPER